MFINDPKRTFVDVAAAMIWIGLEPTDTASIEKHGNGLFDCLDFLRNAAEHGEIRYYDKALISLPSLGTTEPIKVPQYYFTLQSLIDFAKIKNHRLVLLDGKAKSDTPIGTEKPLTTSERNTLLKQIGALSLALAERSSKYKRGDKPNALQIATLTIEVVDALPGANATGVGTSNIRESIRQGIELLTAVQQ